MLEIGVQSGGSMIIWPQWFSDIDFTYIGVDINPLCLQLDMCNDDQIHVEIGSQEDPVFLQGLCDKYGPFDIIIDDGGHTAKQMITTLRTLFPCIKEGGFMLLKTQVSLPLKTMKVIECLKERILLNILLTFMKVCIIIGLPSLIAHLM